MMDTDWLSWCDHVLRVVSPSQHDAGLLLVLTHLGNGGQGEQILLSPSETGPQISNLQYSALFKAGAHGGSIADF